MKSTKTTALIPAVMLVATLAAWHQMPAIGQTAMLPAPGFHHLHLNSLDPDAAIDFYTRQFPTTSKSSWGGMPALKSPNNVLVLFTKVVTAPLLVPQTALWHWGFHVKDVRKTLDEFKRRSEVKLLPLYTSDEGGSVLISSDTWPGTGGVLGLTKAQVAEARTQTVRPTGGGGFAYLQGPDGVIVEYVGNQPVDRMNHVHMWQEDPFCAQFWYQKHFDAPAFAGRTPPAGITEANCKVARGADRSWPALEKDGTYRVPTAAVMFGDVALTWYMNQGDKPLASSRGHVMDHIALSVADLDAWMAKLRSEGIKLGEPYKLGDTRAVMLEGPSREALELVEVK
jgi:catechol 2,3-dioxygenase-like lactoylglutathione lyase family enzyme